MEVACNAMQTLLQEYARQDSLVLEDHTRELEKPHSIKISSSEESLQIFAICSKE